MDTGRLTDAMSAAAHTLAVDQVTAEVVSAFRASSIEPVLLKGPTFANWLYPRQTLRPYVDTDLLVSPRDQQSAAEILRSIGFSDAMAGALQHERDDHSRTFQRPRPGSRHDEVDLHFTLAGARAGQATVWSAITRNTVGTEVAGVHVDALDQAGRALHVALHAAQDSRATDQPLEDLARALTVVDAATWLRATALAHEIDAVSAFTAGLARTPQGRLLLPELGIDPSAAGTYERLRRGSPPEMALGIARLVERRDSRGLIRELAREVVPSAAFMRLWSPLARRGRFGLAAAYLWRPFSLLLRLAPAVNAYVRARRATSRVPPIQSDPAPAGPPENREGAA